MGLNCRKTLKKRKKKVRKCNTIYLFPGQNNKKGTLYNQIYRVPKKEG